jgi:hypothetical protein
MRREKSGVKPGQLSLFACNGVSCGLRLGIGKGETPMTTKPFIDWDEAFEDAASEMGRRTDAVDDAKVAAKREKEFRAGVRLGWWDADGNALLCDDESEEE